MVLNCKVFINHFSKMSVCGASCCKIKFILYSAGFLKKSHFFLTHDYSPFVSKTQTPMKFKNDNCNIQSDLMDYVKYNEKSEACDKWRNYKELSCCGNIFSCILRSIFVFYYVYNTICLI